MAIKEYPEISYGFSQPLVENEKGALIYDRDPTGNDITSLARPWLNRLTGNYFILTLISGSPPQATWSVVADPTPDGTDGQLLTGRTGLTPTWQTLGSDGSILVDITTTPGQIILSVVPPGVAAQYQTDAGNAAPLLGVTQMIGGTNIGSTGAANAVTFNLDDNVTLAGNLVAGGAVTAATDFTMTAGTCTITSDQDAADCIYLRANGGVNETIRIRSDQGTGNNSLTLTSDVGSVNMNSGRAANNALIINASNAAGGIDCDFGTGGFAIDGANGPFNLVTGTGAINLGADAAQKNIVIGNVTGTTSITCNVGTGNAEFGTSATAHDTILGSTNTTSSATLQSGTGNTTITSTGTIDADAAGNVSLNSTGGTLNVGNDDNDFAINIGTQGERTTTIGNIVGANALAFNAGSGNIVLTATNSDISLISGTGDVNIGADATVHAVTVGSTSGAASTILQSGTGNTSITSTGTVDIDATGNVSLNSTAGTLNIGNDDNDFDINIGTQGERTTTIGNIVGANALAFNAGTGNIILTATNSEIGLVSGTGDINIGADATAKDIVIGAVNGASSCTLNSGTGDIALNSTLGSTIITATEDAADAIYLHTNGGVNETLRLHADQGTGAASIAVTSDVGGVAVTSGLAAANSIRLNASNAAGGFDFDYGTGGFTIDSVNGAFTMQTGTGAISIGTDAAAKNIVIGNATGASSLTCDVGTGNANFGTSATVHATTVGSLTGAASTVLRSGTGNTSITSTGTVDVDATGNVSLNSTAGTLNIGDDADAFGVNVCTGAASRDLVAGSTNTTSSTTVQAGTGGIALNAAGIVSMQAATATVAGVALTINANVGYGIFTGQVTGIGAQTEFTITNNVCTVNSVILVTASTAAGNDARMNVTRVRPAAGSFTVYLMNDGPAALNSNVTIAFWIMVA